MHRDRCFNDWLGIIANILKGLTFTKFWVSTNEDRRSPQHVFKIKCKAGLKKNKIIRNQWVGTYILLAQTARLGFNQTWHSLNQCFYTLQERHECNSMESLLHTCKVLILNVLYLYPKSLWTTSWKYGFIADSSHYLNHCFLSSQVFVLKYQNALPVFYAELWKVFRVSLRQEVSLRLYRILTGLNQSVLLPLLPRILVSPHFYNW